MSKDHGQGIFTMPDITEITTMSDIWAARGVAYAIVDNSTARDSNKTKANAMIAKATTIKSLALGMSNFSLSHQGLKVL